MRRLGIALILAAAVFGQPLHHNDLSWTASVTPGISGYHIWRSATSPVPTVPGTSYATVGPTVLAFTDLAVVEGQTIFYVVTAYNTGGDSVPSNQVTCLTPFQAPGPPTGLSGIAK